MNATSNQPSVASEPALSTEAVIGIVELIVAVFVPLIGFPLRRLLSKKLAQQPMQRSQEPQLELGLAFPTSTTTHGLVFATCTKYTFFSSATFSDSPGRVRI
ncbi:uncharacterized protein BKA78DRAFT_292248 [Phyllosticta capitalensis]|uniref:uncharacterized protein n=1 Tax=Phyllosticta capitalensis TaxID=121624 RepID=UPI00312D1A9B